MKFKKSPDGVRSIKATDRFNDSIRVDAETGGQHMWFITTNGNNPDKSGPIVMATHKQALKLAWAIIEELDPSIL